MLKSCSKTDGHSFGEGSCITTTHRVWAGRCFFAKGAKERDRARARERKEERASQLCGCMTRDYVVRKDRTRLFSLLAKRDAPRVTECARSLYHETKKKNRYHNYVSFDINE